jgi:hypothetical protein
MKVRHVYLVVMIVSAAFVMFSSMDVKPDQSMLKVFGYNIGLNYTNYLWVKVLGFVSLCLYVFNPKLKKERA